MKAFKVILDVVTLLLAIASAVYLVATYGDKIVAWAKGLLGKYCGKYVDKGESAEAPAEETEAAPVEETPAAEESETPAEPEAPAESAEPEAPAEPESFEDGTPVADEADFE